MGEYDIESIGEHKVSPVGSSGCLQACEEAAQAWTM
jgi:hypothetical protein